MNKIIEKEEVNVEDMIYEIRGVQVMLDSDLAKLYQCKNGAKSINLAVKRHINRFPERFMFKLSEAEYKNLRFQFETANNMSRSLPYAFTEQGVAMLATVLRTSVAETISIKIMDAFVNMRHYINYNYNILPNRLFLLEEKVSNNSKRIDELFDKFNSKIIADNYLYFNGEFYDAYSKVQEIFKIAKKDLIVIDGFADNTVLDIIRRLNVKVTLIVKPKRLLSRQDVERYNMQYHNLKVIFDDTFHDRYFILDKNEVYHCGTSVNKIGARTFSMTKINDQEISNQLIEKVSKIMTDLTN